MLRQIIWLQDELADELSEEGQLICHRWTLHPLPQVYIRAIKLTATQHSQQSLEKCESLLVLVLLIGWQIGTCFLSTITYDVLLNSLFFIKIDFSSSWKLLYASEANFLSKKV